MKAQNVTKNLGFPSFIHIQSSVQVSRLRIKTLLSLKKKRKEKKKEKTDYGFIVVLPVTFLHRWNWIIAIYGHNKRIKSRGPPCCFNN